MLYLYCAKKFHSDSHFVVVVVKYCFDCYLFIIAIIINVIIIIVIIIIVIIIIIIIVIIINARLLLSSTMLNFKNRNLLTYFKSLLEEW